MRLKLRPAALLLLFFVMLLQTACQFKGDQAHALDEQASATTANWRPVPVAIRVYPTSRFARVDHQLIIEARVEMMDEMGDPTKASGQLHLELQTTGHVSGSEEPQELYKWDVSLRTLHDQQVAYDPITRAYLFRLKLDQQQAPNVPTTLFVTLVRPNGQRLEARAILPVTR